MRLAALMLSALSVMPAAAIAQSSMTSAPGLGTFAPAPKNVPPYPACPNGLQVEVRSPEFTWCRAVVHPPAVDALLWTAYRTPCGAPWYWNVPLFVSTPDAPNGLKQVNWICQHEE